MGAAFGKRPAPGLAFIKNKKKKTASLVKDFNFSSVDDEGQIVTVFPISINLSEVSEKFGQLSVLYHRVLLRHKGFLSCNAHVLGTTRVL